MNRVLFRIKSRLNLQDAHFKELLKGGSTALFLRLGNVLAIYVFNLLLARMLGAEGTGIFAFCFTILNILMVTGRLGLDNYLVKTIAEFSVKERWSTVDQVYKKGILMALIASVILGIVVYFLFPALFKLWDRSVYTDGIRIVAIALLPAVFLNLNAESLRGLKKIKYYGLFQNNTIFLVGIIGLLLLEWLAPSRAENALWAILAGEVVIAIISFIFWRKKKGRNRGGKEIVRSRSILKTALPMLFGSATLYLMSWTDTLMLGFMRPEEEVGIYNIALKVASLTGLIIVAVNSIAAPKISELFSQDKIEAYKKFIHQTTGLIFLTSLPIVVLIFLLPEFILKIFGQEFVNGKISLLILTFGKFSGAFCGPVLVILNMSGKEKTARNILAAIGALNILLNGLFIPRWGIEGAALATMTTTLIWNFLSVFYIYRYFKFWTFGFKWRLK